MLIDSQISHTNMRGRELSDGEKMVLLVSQILMACRTFHLLFGMKKSQRLCWVNA
jgi:hypothetical protein